MWFSKKKEEPTMGMQGQSLHLIAPAQKDQVIKLLTRMRNLILASRKSNAQGNKHRQDELSKEINKCKTLLSLADIEVAVNITSIEAALEELNNG